MTVCGGGTPQTKKEKTLKIDFSKKKENDLPIVSAKQDTLPEVKLELKSEGGKLDVFRDFFDYSTSSVFSKVKDIFLEIEKENRIKEQKEKIQEFEGLAKSIKKAIPNVFKKLIDKIPKLFPSKNAGGGDGQLSESSSGAQAPAEMFPPSSSAGSDDSQEQHLEREKEGNCVINSSSIKEKFLQKESLESKYYFISCTKDEDDEDYTLEQNWGGAFPKTIFKLQELSELSKINIKAKMSGEEVQSEEEDYQFVFEFYSDQFNDEDLKIIGDFKYENDDEEKITSNNKGAIIKLTNPKNIEDKIYLSIDLETD